MRSYETGSFGWTKKVSSKCLEVGGRGKIIAEVALQTWVAWVLVSTVSGLRTPIDLGRVCSVYNHKNQT